MTTIRMIISNGANIPEKEIERHRANYETRLNAFIVEFTDAFIPNGYVIKKEDNLVQHIKNIDKDSMDVRRQIYKQAQAIKDGAKYSQDSTILKGEKPYEPTNTGK